MKRLLYIILLVTIAWSQGFSQTDPRKERYVVLISIDAFKPEFYLDSVWHTPTLDRLMREGVYAKNVKPVFPSVTYPNHISMITGMLPSKHGIYYNKPANDKVARWNASMIKTPTVFDAVHAAGLSSSALYWPVTAESSIQYNIPHAPGMKRKVRVESDGSAEFMHGVASPGLWKELEQNVFGKVSVADVNSDINTGKIASYIIQTYKPTLTAIHFVGIDHAQHRMGLKSKSVAQALYHVDEAIRQIIEAVDQAGMMPYTTFLIVGDHGFCDVTQELAPNVWLRKKGIYRSNGNWKARFHTSNGAAFLYLKNPNDERTLKKVMRILDNLPEDEKRLFRLMNQEELHSVGGDPDAVLALNPVPGIVLRQSGSGKALKEATGGAHGYLADFPEIMTGFIGWGTGINSGTVIQQMNVPDIAPIIARLLEIDFQAEDGQADETIFSNR